MRGWFDHDRRLYDILEGHFRTLPNRIGPATRNSRGRLSARIGHQSGGYGDGVARHLGLGPVSGAPIGEMLRFTTSSRPDAVGACYVTL